MPTLVAASLEEWTSAVNGCFVGLAVTARPGPFSGSLQTVDLQRGTVLTRFRTSPCRVVRSARLARADASDDVLFLLHLGGRAQVQQEHQRSTMSCGYGSVHVADRPYALSFQGAGDEVVLQVPRRLLPSPRLVSVDRRRRGVAPDDVTLRVFRAFVTELLAVSDELAGPALEEMGLTAVDLLVSVLRSGSPQEPARERGGSATLARMHASVRAHLDDPALGPESLAAAHHVSVRHVHHLFAASATTPAAFIRAERLQLAKRLLADPRTGRLPVAVVAARVGFSSTDGFIRAFRAGEGTTPGAWRRAVAVPTPSG